MTVKTENATIDRIKIKYKALIHKKSFVNDIAEELKLSSVYLLQNWFQGKWKIPADKMELIATRLDERIIKQIEELELLSNE